MQRNSLLFQVGLILNSTIISSTEDLSSGSTLVHDILVALAASIIFACIVYLIKRRQKQSKHFESNWIFARDLKPDDLLKGRPYKQQYYPRTEDKLLKDLILQKKNVLVRGSPLAGKTRTIFEALKNMDLSYDVIIPRSEDIDVEDYPFPGNCGLNPKVVILDDLNRYVNVRNFEKLFQITRNKNFIIVATCQTGDPFNIVKSKLVDKRLDIETIFGKNIIDIGDITEDEARQIAKNETINWKDTEFDGTIGSIFLKLGEMRNRYNALGATEKDILKTIKKLQISGIYEGKHTFPYEWIETAFNVNYSDTKFKWEHVLGPLKRSELVSVPEEKKIHVEEVYLEKIVEFSDIQSELTILNEMINIFSDKKDVLHKIVNKAAFFSLVRAEKVDFAKVAINAYETALKLINRDELPVDYAMTLNNLGVAYWNLAQEEDSKNNLSKAIRVLEKSLSVRSLDKFPIYYADTLYNLGLAYDSLSSIENKRDNRLKAIELWEEALKLYKKEMMTDHVDSLQLMIDILRSQSL